VADSALIKAHVLRPGTSAGITGNTAEARIDPITGGLLVYIVGGGGDGGTGGAVTIADGAFETFGAKADSPATNDSGAFTHMALLKRSLAHLQEVIDNTLQTVGELQTLNTSVGLPSDTPAPDDSGTWTYISLFKRQLAQLQVALTTLAHLDATQGDIADSPATDDTGAFSLVAFQKRQLEQIQLQLNELLGLRATIGYTDDPPAASDTAVDTLMAFTKRLLQRITVLIDQNVDNTALQMIAPGVKSATTSSADQPNRKWRGAHFVIETTAITGTPSITVRLEAKNPFTGSYYPILESSPITMIGTVVLKTYPGFPGQTLQVSADFLPAVFRVTVVHLNADPVDYSVTAMLQL